MDVFFDVLIVKSTIISSDSTFTYTILNDISTILNMPKVKENRL